MARSKNWSYRGSAVMWRAIAIAVVLSGWAFADDGAPVAPPGYATEPELYAAFGLGQIQVAGQDLIEPEGMEVRSDIEYGNAGDRPLLLDLYFPAERGESTPCVVIIHGGGWNGGDKAQREYRFYIYPLVARGYIVASVGYRFSDEAKYPAAVKDAMCAIRYLKANAPEYGIDGENVAVAGWSAGAHLAMMIGYAGDHPELNSGGGWENTPCDVKCVINLYGPTDLTFDFARDHALVQAFMPATYAENPEVYAEASPLTHVDSTDPPTLTIHGTLDTLVGIQHGDVLAQKLNKVGVPYLYDRVEGWPHVLDMEKRLHERTKFLMFEFLDTYLPLGPEEATD